GADAETPRATNPREALEFPGRVHIPEDEVPGRSGTGPRVGFEAGEDRVLAIREEHDYRHVFTLEGGKFLHDGTGGRVEDGFMVDDPPPVGAEVGMIRGLLRGVDERALLSLRVPEPDGCRARGGRLAHRGDPPAVRGEGQVPRRAADGEA